MRKFIFGFDPHALQSMQKPFPVTAQIPTKQELLKIGIPPRKVERVRQELIRLAGLDATLNKKQMLLKLAKELQNRFV